MEGFGLRSGVWEVALVWLGFWVVLCVLAVFEVDFRAQVENWGKSVGWGVRMSGRGLASACRVKGSGGAICSLHYWTGGLGFCALFGRNAPILQ